MMMTCREGTLRAEFPQFDPTYLGKIEKTLLAGHREGREIESPVSFR